MAGWNTSMPTDFVNGQLVNEADLDPIVNNVGWVRYATVFESGQRRTSAVGAIVATEIAVLQAPAVIHENGILYKIEGMCKVRSSVAGDFAELRVHEGAGLLGAVPQSFSSPALGIANAGYVVPFSVYVKSIAQVSQTYTLGVRRLQGTGTLTVDTTSWISILRSGDNALMTDA